MRWPIKIQLLLPMLSVVVLAIALASVVSAYLGAVRARQAQEESLARVVATLAETKFPLSKPVLEQTSGLSGAQFVLFDDADRLQAATMQLDREELDEIRKLPRTQQSAIGQNPSLRLGGRMYLSQRVVLVSRRPLPGTGSLIVLYPEDRWSATIRQAAYPALAAGALAVMAVVLVTTLLAQRFVRPIRRLGDQTAAIAGGNFTPVAVSDRDDEIRDLAISINQMTQRLGDYEREVRRTEQRRTLGQIGAGIAHQLRNAATGARMAIELHQRHCAAGGDGESLAVALRQLRLMESYLQRFLTLSRPRPACRQPTSLAALAEDARALVEPACHHAGIELVFEQKQPSPAKDSAPAASPLHVYGDPDELRQLLLNLLMNAVEAISGADAKPARIVIELESPAADRVVLHVVDSGPGPAAEIRERLFEPFVTGKPDGTGLGLFVARQIVEDHGGSICCCRRNGLNCFTIELPTSPPA